VCTICTRADRQAIDAALVAGESNRRIAAQCRVSENALRRHKAAHLPVKLAKAQEAQDVARADDLLRQVRALQGSALRILIRAEQEGDGRTALAAIREARGNLELLAKLLGELDERPVVNLVVAPEWVSFRSVLLHALAPFPEARIAAAHALVAAEGNGHADLR
jgi:hypothetical protein